MAKDFFEVFPDELPELPPNKEIEFTNELVPRTRPIPYRIAPIETKELKSQLQEMLEKGFNQPNFSHWRASVLS